MRYSAMQRNSVQWRNVSIFVMISSGNTMKTLQNLPMERSIRHITVQTEFIYLRSEQTDENFCNEFNYNFHYFCPCCFPVRSFSGRTPSPISFAILVKAVKLKVFSSCRVQRCLRYALRKLCTGNKLFCRFYRQ